MKNSFNKTRTISLSGLLVDIEHGSPDISRFQELKTNICEKLSLRAPDGAIIPISLKHIHFTQTDLIKRDVESCDFLLLSPQGTPWRSYTGSLARMLQTLTTTLINAVQLQGLPVLAICGGHQFLAASFGARVDFIDPAFERRTLSEYPPEAIAERGLVYLETLASDRIFEGVVVHPGNFAVLESHTEEVKNAPHPFANLARSATSEIQLLTIPDALVYGMAFHPERGWTQAYGPDSQAAAGKQLLGNFFRLVHVNKSGAI